MLRSACAFAALLSVPAAASAQAMDPALYPAPSGIISRSQRAGPPAARSPDRSSDGVCEFA